MRRPKPYYKNSHHGWYLNLNGKTIRLASEEEGEQAAYTEYDALMFNRQPTRHDSPVVVLLDH
jgi:hypothetical protein